MTGRMRSITLPGMAESPWVDVPAGARLIDLQPTSNAPQVLILRVNGEYLLRREWDRCVKPGDTIEWLIDPPGDRETFRTALQVAAIAASFIAPEFAPYLAAANVAYNLLVPPRQPEFGDPASAVFNASVSGNVARLDEPIWRTFGVDKITPPFACMPYSEFIDDDGDNIDNQQYFYAVLAVGFGPYDLLAEFLGKTPVGHYQDVLIHSLLAPGESPSRVQANVWTSQDVSGFELEVKLPTGSYTACPPTRKVSTIGVDIVAPEGLGFTDDEGGIHSITVNWLVQIREINDAGAPIGRFRTIGTEARTVESNTPQRWSSRYDVSPPARVEVRVARTNETIRAPNVRDKIVWTGLRGYGDTAAPLDPYTSHYEIVLRASKNLSQQNQSDISLIVQGKSRTWHPDTGWSCALHDFDNYTAHRSPAWALADLWSDTAWGEGLPDERIDLQGLYDFSLINASRQDRFDYTFSRTTDAWAASQLIAAAGRARVFRRYGVRTLRRDELATLPETAFTARMCVAGTTMVVDERRPRSSDPDGIIVTFRSNAKWDQDSVECPCPGVVSMERPVYQQYPGIQGRTHALREGLYNAASMALRQRTVSFQTEMQAVLTSFLAPVLWVPQIVRYATTGDVAFWDADSLTMGLTEPIDFSVTPVYLSLRRDDGTMTTAVPVTPGPTPYDVVLSEAPDFTLVLDDGTRERPVFIAGPVGSSKIVKTGAISDGGRSAKGAQYYKVTAVVDDDRVHEADNAYLPGPGDDQDPIGLPGDGEGTGGTEIVILDGGPFSVGQPVLGGAHYWTLGLDADGRAYYTSDDNAGVPQYLVHQWINIAPVDVSIADDYEVFFAPANSSYDVYFTGDTLRAWLSLGTSRAISLGPFEEIDRVPVAIDVTIRLASDGSVQTTARFTVTMNIIDLH